MSSYIGDVIETRLNRRGFVQGVAAVAAMPGAALAAAPATLGFAPISSSKDDRIILPPGYTHDVLLRWGDSLRPDVPHLDTSQLAAGMLFSEQAARAQQGQFGTNCDALHFFQLNAGPRSVNGLLCVNNEYTNDVLMYPGRKPVFGSDPDHVREQVRRHPGIVATSQAAQGISVVEVALEGGRWRYRRASASNRRITATTPCEIRGPARGAALMKTRADPQGVQVLGTFANCAGGRTPWDSYLSAEENIQDYFGNLDALRARRDADPAALAVHRRWRMWRGLSPYGWDAVDARFDLGGEPNEAFRFGWIVEVDPHDPTRAPRKRTALGRFAHEAAETVVAQSGQLAVYMGDDDRFEYVYKYVSRGRVTPGMPALNETVLDQGTLYVARFNADGSGDWLPLVHDARGPLNAATGFRDQAEVLINARAAGDALGATMMDRPEDIQANPRSGRVYIACTNNSLRGNRAAPGAYGNRRIDLGPNPANTRGDNRWGHIIELVEQEGDHTGRRFRWEVLLEGGRERGFGSPDNLGFDARGNLWIVTDGEQPQGGNNGCHAFDLANGRRGTPRQFMSGPVGAEIAGCEFTPDNRTLFLSVQHPGETGTLDKPTSHWPDGGKLPPRAAVIAVRREDGGIVGS